MVIFGAALTSPAVGETPWADELALQIKAAHDCDVALLAQVLERQSKDGLFIMAKVHCEDGRTFDAVKPSDSLLFTFNKCGEPQARGC